MYANKTAARKLWQIDNAAWKAKLKFVLQSAKKLKVSAHRLLNVKHSNILYLD